jgi:hypothetical protein
MDHRQPDSAKLESMVNTLLPDARHQSMQTSPRLGVPIWP